VDCMKVLFMNLCSTILILELAAAFIVRVSLRLEELETPAYYIFLLVYMPSYFNGNLSLISKLSLNLEHKDSTERKSRAWTIFYVLPIDKNFAKNI
jgi:hypothetical protein